MNKISIIGIIIAIVGAVLFILDLFMDLFPFCSWVGVILFIVGSSLAMQGENAEQSEKSLLKLLMYVSAADGELDSEEAKILSATAARIGVSQEEFKKMAEEISTGQINFVIPESDETKKEHIRELVKMMKADGDIDDNELKIIKQVAEKYGFKSSYVDSLI